MIYHDRNVDNVPFVNRLQSLEAVKWVIISDEELYKYAKDSSYYR